MRSYEGEGRVGCWTFTLSLGVAALGDLIGGAVSNHLYNDEKAAEYLTEAGYTVQQKVDTKIFAVMFRGCGVDAGVGHEYKVLGPTNVASTVIVCDAPLQGAEIRQAS